MPVHMDAELGYRPPPMPVKAAPERTPGIRSGTAALARRSGAPLGARRELSASLAPALAGPRPAAAGRED
jgi:hypothetical protein